MLNGPATIVFLRCFHDKNEERRHRWCGKFYRRLSVFVAFYKRFKTWLFPKTETVRLFHPCALPGGKNKRGIVTHSPAVAERLSPEGNWEKVARVIQLS